MPTYEVTLSFSKPGSLALFNECAVITVLASGPAQARELAIQRVYIEDMGEHVRVDSIVQLLPSIVTKEG